MKIYEIRNDFNYSQFLPTGDNSFVRNTLHWSFPIKKDNYCYELEQSIARKKNFNLDISKQSNHLILSDKSSLLFAKYGDFFDIKTKSKRKKFKGFFPNKSILDKSYIDVNKSDFKLLDNKNIAYDNVCFSKKIENITCDVFVIEQVLLNIYVSEKFKKMIEESQFGGLEFHLVYDSDLPSDWKFEIIKSSINNPLWSDVLKGVYGLNSNLDFEDIVLDKDVVEELPFMNLYERYEDILDTPSKEFHYLSKYDIMCAKDSNLQEVILRLRQFILFLQEHKIYLKNKYWRLCPSIEVFDDGVMINGRFIKNKDLLNGVIKES